MLLWGFVPLRLRLRYTQLQRNHQNVNHEKCLLLRCTINGEPTQRHRFEQAQLRRTRQHHRNKEQGFVLQDCTVTGL